MLKACPLCEHPLTKKKDEVYYDCETCRALVKDPNQFPTPAEEKGRYLEHHNDVDDPRYQKFTSPIHSFVLEHYAPYHKGLDFGSGTGPVISKILSDKGYNIVQYDPIFAPDEDLLDGRYDYIACCEVVEHLHYPAREFERLREMLNPGGRLLIMTFLYHESIDFKNWVYRNDDTHVFIFRKETMEYVAHLFDFEIEVLEKRFVVLRKPAD
jgi:SAM-dependent methyltransferase